MNIEEAIYFLKRNPKVLGELNVKEIELLFDKEEGASIDDLKNEAIQVVLNELDKKEAVINEMAGHIILMNDNGGLTREEKIEYFTNKVEREGK